MPELKLLKFPASGKRAPADTPPPSQPDLIERLEPKLRRIADIRPSVIVVFERLIDDQLARHDRGGAA